VSSVSYYIPTLGETCKDAHFSNTGPCYTTRGGDRLCASVAESVAYEAWLAVTDRDRLINGFEIVIIHRLGEDIFRIQPDWEMRVVDEQEKS
jgi:hypothetical protein